MANDYDSKATQIRQLAGMPSDQLVDHLTNAHPNISNTAPNVAPHVFSTATNAIQFLNSKLPSHGNELPQDRAPGPSQQQKNAWLDLHKTVSDPVSILDHVKNGTLNSHHMEALQTVYPDLHQEMLTKMTEHLGSMQANDKQLPYARRMAISKFVGQPLDSTMTPESFQAILSSAGQNTAQAAQNKSSPKKASGVQLNQLNKVNQLYETPLQQREIPGKG
jgi:hypothetical protein